MDPIKWVYIVIGLMILFSIIALIVPSIWPSQNIGHNTKAIREKTFAGVSRINIGYFFHSIGKKVGGAINKAMPEKKVKVKLTQPVASKQEEPPKEKYREQYPMFIYDEKTCKGFQLGDTYGSDFVSFSVTPYWDETTQSWLFYLRDAFTYPEESFDLQELYPFERVH
jgi:hypothetical protein